MDNIVKLPSKEREKLFMEAGKIRQMPTFMIEKDFWVSWVLDKIFSHSQLAEILCFKGGTSLSKAFSIIERFSEDIDLILAEKVILVDDESYEQATKTKQDKFNKEINTRAGLYISTKLKDMIEEVISPICTIRTDDTDKHVLWLTFPTKLSYKYIRPEIKLEIGPLALWNPNDKYILQTQLDIALPELKMKNPIVPTVKAERTFWEKITILHLEHYRPEAKIIADRYSRHYYDVYKLGNSSYKNLALNQLDLLSEVVEFKKRFYPCTWASYDTAKIGTIKLFPASHSMTKLEKDYKQMHNMITGDYPSWQEIIDYLIELEKEINE